jgi:hypothetical protein
MSRLYACIISRSAKKELAEIARQFSYSIETLDDGVLFDISGLERLIGKPEKIAQKILDELKHAKIPGSIAVRIRWKLPPCLHVKKAMESIRCVYRTCSLSFRLTVWI